MADSKILTDILPLFLEEAAEVLQPWDKNGAVLAKSPTRELIQEVTKGLEKLKGSALGMGLVELSVYTQQILELMDFLLGRGLANFAEQGPFLESCRALLKDWLKELAKNPEFIPDLVPHRKSFVQLNPAAQIEIVKPKSMPSLGTILVDNKDATPEQVEKAVQLQERKLGEVMVDAGMVTPEAVGRALQTQKVDPKKVAVVEQIRVPASRIDALLKAIGELSIHQSIVWHSKQSKSLDSKPAQNAIILSNKIIKEVQSQVMALRLQPLRSLFQKLERVARDVSMSQGKSIVTRVEGADVDLDKAVIEKITDSMIHIIRNGIDHGIEGQEERKKKGKPETATLTISAVQDTSDVLLTVTDDGRGMDPKKILTKAIEKGFVAPGAQMKAADVLNLIFLPGFSTAEQVTEFSGRGVGMDVVNRVVSELGGTVSIRSEQGLGSTFTIAIPTSVSLIDAVVFGVDGLRYVVPMRDLVEVLDLAGYQREGHSERGQMVSLRGEVVPVERLRSYLPRNLEETEAAAPDAEATSTIHVRSGRMPALVIKSEAGSIAFEVDEIVGQQQIVVRGLSENMATIPGIVGGTILGNGEPGMIVGLGQIARDYFQNLRAKEATS